MRDVSDFNRKVEYFCTNHKMVNSYHHLSSVEQVDGLGDDYRRVIIVPSGFSIDRDTYSIEYLVVVQDKIRSGDAVALSKSTEGNVFVLGQLMDYLVNLDADIVINGGSFAPTVATEDGYNIITAVGTISFETVRSVFRNFTI